MWSPEALSRHWFIAVPNTLSASPQCRRKAASNSIRVPRAVSGYNVVRWVENGVSYWAVSDIEAKQLEDFARLFRTSKTEL